MHEKAMEWTSLDPVLPKWSLATYLRGQKRDIGADMKAEDVKEEASEEKAVKVSQPVDDKVAPPKASSAKGPDTGTKESPRSARSAVVLKSASGPAVKEKADAILGKENPDAKAPHPREGKDTGVKVSEAKEEDDIGAKAPHGNSSDDEDDEELGARLRSASKVYRWFLDTRSASQVSHARTRQHLMRRSAGLLCIRQELS